MLVAQRCVLRWLVTDVGGAGACASVDRQRSAIALQHQHLVDGMKKISHGGCNQYP